MCLSVSTTHFARPSNSILCRCAREYDSAKKRCFVTFELRGSQRMHPENDIFICRCRRWATTLLTLEPGKMYRCILYRSALRVSLLCDRRRTGLERVCLVKHHQPAQIEPNRDKLHNSCDTQGTSLVYHSIYLNIFMFSHLICYFWFTRMNEGVRTYFQSFIG